MSSVAAIAAPADAPSLQSGLLPKFMGTHGDPITGAMSSGRRGRPTHMTAAPTLQIDEVAVPADLAIWLDADMHAFFHELPRSQKRRYVDRIEQARTPEARERRIAATVGLLRAGRNR